MNDFYKTCNESIKKLNSNEQVLLDYVFKNINAVKDKSIRQFAKDCFVSTTTIVRFVQKLGFKGYREFIDMIRFTLMKDDDNIVPTTFRKGDYKGDYLLNVTETLRVISDEQMNDLFKVIDKNTNIYFSGYGLSQEAARYAYHIFTAIGLKCILPQEDYEIKRLQDRITSNDILFVISLSGNNTKTISIMEDVILKSKPTIVSITKAGSNMIEIMSDYNFYFFNNEFTYKEIDLTSRIGMFSIIDILSYNYVKHLNVSLLTKK